MTSVWRTITKTNRMPAVLFSAVAIFGSAGMAHAGVLTIIAGNTLDAWDTESGQSIPTGTAGFLAGTLFASTADYYTFTYGGGGLLPGDTGHGDSNLLDVFWVGSSESDAAALGHLFCISPGDPACGGVPTAVNAQFTLFLPAGPIPFGFRFGTLGDILLNGQSNNAVGAYLAQIGLGATPFAGPGLVGYLGLSDRTYPDLDHDFQDLVVTVSTTPEPAPWPLLAGGLIGLACYGWLRNSRQ